MDATILRLLFISDPLVLNQVGALLFLKHYELLFDLFLLIFKQFELKLIDFSLLVFVNIIELAFLEVKLRVFIDQR